MSPELLTHTGITLASVSCLAWLVKHWMTGVDGKLEKHDGKLTELMVDVAKLSARLKTTRERRANGR